MASAFQYSIVQVISIKFQVSNCEKKATETELRTYNFIYPHFHLPSERWQQRLRL
jgi:hypothetical protein